MTGCSASLARRQANLLPHDGEVWLIEAAIVAPDADRLQGALLAAIDWRQETATVMGRRVPIPRLTAWHGETGYVYSGIRMSPMPWNAPLLELKAAAEACACQAFNSVLLNLYRDGRDSVSWHADNEPGLGRDPVIASISLGAVRRFQLKHRQSGARVALDLGHGSCLVMAGATQHHWLHQLPKTAQPVGPRVNLTFRSIRDPGAADAARPSQAAAAPAAGGAQGGAGRARRARPKDKCR